MWAACLCTCLCIFIAGKSTFIKYLLGRDYPGIHIGPEPTTDRRAGGRAGGRPPLAAAPCCLPLAAGPCCRPLLPPSCRMELEFRLEAAFLGIPRMGWVASRGCAASGEPAGPGRPLANIFRLAPPCPPLRFVVVMHGPEERRTPGNTLVVQPDKPYQVGSVGLSSGGQNYAWYRAYQELQRSCLWDREELPGWGEEWLERVRFSIPC